MKKRWEGNINEGTGIDLPYQLGQLITGQDGKGLSVQSHLWFPDDMPMLLDRIDKRKLEKFRLQKQVIYE